MTEEEAKTKWCPMVRLDGVEGEAVNREQIYGTDRAIFNSAMYCCIGSACMMWRVEITGSRSGWCGLAGTPLVARL